MKRFKFHKWRKFSNFFLLLSAVRTNLNVNEISSCFISNCFCYQCLTTSRRPIQQKTCLHIHSKSLSKNCSTIHKQPFNPLTEYTINQFEVWELCHMSAQINDKNITSFFSFYKKVFWTHGITEPTPTSTNSLRVWAQRVSTVHAWLSSMLT